MNKYRINGDALHLFTHGTLIPKKSIQVIVHIPQDDGTSIIRISVESLAPIDVQITQAAEAGEFLLALENWLASKNRVTTNTIQENLTVPNVADTLITPEAELDEFGIPSQPKTQEELELFLKGATSFEESLGVFNRKQEKEEIEKLVSSSTNKETIDNKRVFSAHMFDLSD